MTRIVDIDKLVPEDVEFHYRGEKYLISGDPLSPYAMRLMGLLQDAIAAQDADLKTRAKHDDAIREELLALFRVHQPDLAEWPFGNVASQAVLAEVMVVLQIAIDDVPPSEPKPEKMAIPRSRRSTGSPRSPKSSGGRQKRGG